jgi:translation initiation factor IF-3
VGEHGEQLGIMPLYQAREVARRNDLDLVEVAATANPPVCRLLNYGKFRYEQEKKDREAKRGQKTSSIREIRLRPKIGEGDFDTKVRQVRKLIEDGDKVRVTVMFRGREITHPDLALKLVQKVIESLKDIAIVEASPAMDGRRMVAQLAQSPSLKAKSKEKVQEPQNA